MPECALPADFNKQHGLLAKPYKHLVHRAVLEQHIGEFKPFSTNPFQLNRKGIAHSSRTWQNSEKHVYLFLGYCHHYQQVSQPTLQLFLSSPLIAQYVSFHTAAGHSQLYIMNFLSCAKCVLRWWQSKPGGNHPSFVEGLEWLQTLGLQCSRRSKWKGSGGRESSGYNGVGNSRSRSRLPTEAAGYLDRKLCSHAFSAVCLR
ncbi:hypothetical protein ABBQ38_006416 [Trebouxia sp. C0009 RCD-2024]